MFLRSTPNSLVLSFFVLQFFPSLWLLVFCHWPHQLLSSGVLGFHWKVLAKRLRNMYYSFSFVVCLFWWFKTKAFIEFFVFSIKRFLNVIRIFFITILVLTLNVECLMMLYVLWRLSISCKRAHRRGRNIIVNVIMLRSANHLFCGSHHLVSKIETQYSWDTWDNRPFILLQIMIFFL